MSSAKYTGYGQSIPLAKNTNNVQANIAKQTTLKNQPTRPTTAVSTNDSATTKTIKIANNTGVITNRSISPVPKATSPQGSNTSFVNNQKSKSPIRMAPSQPLDTGKSLAKPITQSAPSTAKTASRPATKPNTTMASKAVISSNLGQPTTTLQQYITAKSDTGNAQSSVDKKYTTQQSINKPTDVKLNGKSNTTNIQKADPKKPQTPGSTYSLPKPAQPTSVNSSPQPPLSARITSDSQARNASPPVQRPSLSKPSPSTESPAVKVAPPVPTPIPPQPSAQEPQLRKQKLNEDVNVKPLTAPAPVPTNPPPQNTGARPSISSKTSQPTQQTTQQASQTSRPSISNKTANPQSTATVTSPKDQLSQPTGNFNESPAVINSLKQAANILKPANTFKPRISMLQAVSSSSNRESPALQQLIRSFSNLSQFTGGDYTDTTSMDLKQIHQLKKNEVPDSAWIPGYKQNDDSVQKLTFRSATISSIDLGGNTLKLLSGIEEILKNKIQESSEAEETESMISDVCELEVEQHVDPEKNVRRILNGDSVYDVPLGYTDWQNWTIKTFKPQTSVGGLGKELKVNHFTDNTQIFEAMREELSSNRQVFEDPNFKPNMMALRGFGGDSTWEQLWYYQSNIR